MTTTPFRVDSKDEYEPQSPVLLTNPAGVDTAVADTTDVATWGIEGALTGKAIVKTTDTAPTADPPNEVTPVMKAAIVLAVVNALKSAMEIHLSPIDSCLKGMQSDISSNHGHITKRIFPALEAKLTTLDGTLDSKTRELDAKGESLHAKITSLDGMIATNVGERIANSETKVEVATVNFDARIAALKSQGLEAQPSTGLPHPKLPTAAVPAVAPAMTSRREGNEDADFISPDDDTIDVTTCTQVAYAIARERNSFLHAGPSGSQPQPTITPRRGHSPVRNLYNALVAAPSPSHPSLHQTTILESFGHSEHPASSNQDNSSRRSGDSVQGNSGGSRGSQQVVGGPIISLPHCNRAMHARILGASCFDVIRLATKDYHGGMDGIVNLMEEAIQACGYGQVKATAEDVMVCYNNIILAHCKVSELWHNGYAHTATHAPPVLQPVTTPTPFSLDSMLPTPVHAAPPVLSPWDCHANEPPSAEPPPLDLHVHFPPCALMDEFMWPPSPTFVTTMINLHENQAMASILLELPEEPSLLDSIMHVVCSPRVGGIKGDDDSSVRIMRVTDSTTNGNLIDGGSNVCVMGDLNILLDVVDIAPIDILVALSGSSSLLNDKLSKSGLLPLTLLDGTIYYQTCFYCANMV
jgi:hypothetical protein